MREKNSFTSEFLITSAVHVRSFNYLGLPSMLDLHVGVSLLPTALAIL